MSKGNRQKAGMKSASSHMAAELLSGGGLATFDAFSNGFTSIVETEDTISIKKLSKRDSSTREKALRELMERTKEENVDSIVSTFASFTTHFEKIIFDCSPSVRNLAMKLVAKQVNLLKKKAEKDLFNILPYIVMASSDPFPPCASEASSFLEGMGKEKMEMILNRMGEKLMKIMEEVLVTGESSLLIPSKLMNNDEEDNVEERKGRLSEQCWGVMGRMVRGEKREEGEEMMKKAIEKEKKAELTRGLLTAVSSCVDPVSIISSSSLMDRLIGLYTRENQSILLPIGTELILRVMTEGGGGGMSEGQKRKMINNVVAFIKKCNASEWDTMGPRFLPLFSSFCSLLEGKARETFISQWFGALQANGVVKKESIIYSGDCVKFVLSLLECPSVEETTTAMTMVFFLISNSTSPDPSYLTSLIGWTIGRVKEEKRRIYLEECVRRCVEKLPSSRPLLHSLLSLHSPDLLFAWKYLMDNEIRPLPIELLSDADDSTLLSVNDSIGVQGLLEKSEDRSLAELYYRLYSLLPSTSEKKEEKMAYSPLVSSLLTRVKREEMERIVKRMEEEERMKCVEEWMERGEEETVLKMMMGRGEEEKSAIEEKILRVKASLEVHAKLAASMQFSSAFVHDVAVKVLRGYIKEAISGKKVDLSSSTRSIIARLDVDLVLREIMEGVRRSEEYKVSTFTSLSSLFYDLVENGLGLMDEKYFLPLIGGLIGKVEELSQYALLTHFWPLSSLHNLNGVKGKGELEERMEEMKKELGFFLAVYVSRPSEAPSSLLLLPLLILSSLISLTREGPLSFYPEDERESEMMEYARDVVQTGSAFLDPSTLQSLLSSPLSPSSLSLLSSHLPPSSLSLLIHSLRPLTTVITSGSLPSTVEGPFSALPSGGATLHLEMARQMYYGRRVDQALHCISNHSQEEKSQELFTLECDVPSFSLSLSALTGGWEYLNGEEKEELSHSVQDFLNCGILTALNSCDSDSPSSSKWEEGRRRTLAAAAVQLAVKMNERGDEEWLNFFLPSITPIVLKMYTEVDMVDGSSLAQLINLFLSTHPSLQWEEGWNGQWDRRTRMYDMEMEQAGISSTIQTLVVRASSVLEKSGEKNGEAIIAASRIIAMSATHTVSFSTSDDEKGVTVNLPPFMKNLAAKEGWSRCGVLAAALALVSSPSSSSSSSSPSPTPSTSPSTSSSSIDRSIMCDALAPMVGKALTMVVSQTEQRQERIRREYWEEKPSPRPDYLLHWLCSLLRETCSAFPSITKMWYTGLPKGGAVLVNGFISTHLSPILIEHEMKEVMEGNLPEKHKNDQATLTLRRHANEVLLDYILEDTRMRMSITMPSNWPLSAPSVSVEGSIVGEQDGRKWMLQLNSQLHRNSSLCSALSAWLLHAGKKVDGTEACTICMAIVAPQNKQLPKARCRTCNNKFHSACLYKWFESSNQSSCPLCRTDFTA